MLPPAPNVPVDPSIVRKVLLSSSWQTRSQRNDLWRLRTEAALCVLLAVERGMPMTEVCAMLPREVVRLPLPPFGRRRVRKWLGVRSSYYGASPFNDPSASLPWLTIPTFRPSNGKPRAISWAIMRLFARRGAPCWRVRQLLRAPRWSV